MENGDNNRIVAESFTTGDQRLKDAAVVREIMEEALQIIASGKAYDAVLAAKTAIYAVSSYEQRQAAMNFGECRSLGNLAFTGSAFIVVVGLQALGFVLLQGQVVDFFVSWF